MSRSRIDGRSYQTGIQLGTAENIVLDGVTIDGTVNGIRKGTAAAVTDLDIIGGGSGQLHRHVHLAKETADGLDLNDVLIDGTAFTNLVEKGSTSRRLRTR